MSKCNDFDYKDYITNLYNFSTQTIDSSKQNLLALNGAVVPFNDIVNKYRGEVIYIDFRATWCGHV